MLAVMAAILVIKMPALAQTEAGRHTVKIYGVPVDVSDKAAASSTKSDSSAPTAIAPAPAVNERLDASGKIKFGFKRAFLRPGSYIFPAISSVRQVQDADEPNKDRGDKFADGLTRYAINFSTSSTRNIFAYGVYPAIFKQQPAYEPSQKSGWRARTLHAISRTFVTRGDNGNLQFNASVMAGNMTAAAMANIWEQNAPNRDRIGVAPTFRRFGGMMAMEVLRNIVFREFGGDIKRLILRR